jgi:hypothetical protein
MLRQQRRKRREGRLGSRRLKSFGHGVCELEGQALPIFSKKQLTHQVYRGAFGEIGGKGKGEGVRVMGRGWGGGGGVGGGVGGVVGGGVGGVEGGGGGVREVVKGGRSRTATVNFLF